MKRRPKPQESSPKPRPPKSEPARPASAGSGQNAPARPGQKAVIPATLGHGGYYLLGRHAVEAALGNPRRRVGVLLHAMRHEGRLPKGHERAKPQAADAALLDSLGGPEVPHQGLALEVVPLAPVSLEDVLERSGPSLILVLDQVTDPRNIGAVFRAAAAFGADAIVTQDRHSPPETAALAKAASGALEIVPWVRVTNLSRALDQLAGAGFWRVGLTGHAEKELGNIDPGPRAVLVLGAEGPGMRVLTEKHVDYRAKLPISEKVESLNVATAAAVALYEMRRRG